MRSYIGLAVLLVGLVAPNCALRMRGDPYVGLANVDKRPAATVRTEQNRAARIVGGQEAPQAYAPWQVSVQNQHGNHFCGGAIIADQWVVTAASCVAGLQKKNVKVVTSTNDWTGLAWEYYVEDIVIHCNFDRPLYHNDIALLKLTTLFAYDDVTQNITIADVDDLSTGEKLVMTGWGDEELGAPQFPENLKMLEVSYVPYADCKKAYDNSEDVDVGALCTLAPVGEGACHGDTGGPLVDGKGRLVGIGNWGVPCGYGFPDVFARMVYFNDWIKSTINGCRIK